MSAYRALEARFKRLTILAEAAGLLRWDQSVNMPRGGAAARAEQLAGLQLLRHELLTDPRLPELLDAADAAEDDGWHRANLREMRRIHLHAAAVPPDLVEALARAGSDCEMIWREARPANDFAAVAPSLAGLLDLLRRVGEAKASALGCAPYEALMDQYEPGARLRRIEPLFAGLARLLPDLLERIRARQAAGPRPLPLPGPFSPDAQRALGLELMRRLGFDFEHGRLDASLHPFCGGVSEDVRLTTRYDERDFASSLMAVLHETGHALYKRGLPARWRYQPVGGARGMALHESQSLLIEMQACRSREFFAFAAPLIRRTFAAGGPAWTAENLHLSFTRVAPGPIRVDADEATYPAHVILRFRLEKALLDGALAVDDLPGAWREGMRELLGVVPAGDADGCLQDIHWYHGSFGYFPAYAMGALAAAQLFAAARRARPGIPRSIAAGDFAPLLGWLRDNLHARGSSRSTDELLFEATGAPLGIAAFERHLRARYLEEPP